MEKVYQKVKKTNLNLGEKFYFVFWLSVTEIQLNKSDSYKEIEINRAKFIPH